jgi:cytoskeletal protein CcmA (bactofilin family)
MFQAKTKVEEAAIHSGKTSLIGTGTTIKGHIDCQSDIRIDGKLIGDIFCTAKVVIGSDGEIEGNVIAHQADITGSVKGNIQVKDLLHLRNQAILEGDIVAGKIAMEPTVQFSGHCTTQSSTQVVSMEIDKNERKAAAE